MNYRFWLYLRQLFCWRYRGREYLLRLMSLVSHVFLSLHVLFNWVSAGRSELGRLKDQRKRDFVWHPRLILIIWLRITPNLLMNEILSAILSHSFIWHTCRQGQHFLGFWPWRGNRPQFDPIYKWIRKVSYKGLLLFIWKFLGVFVRFEKFLEKVLDSLLFLLLFQLLVFSDSESFHGTFSFSLRGFLKWSGEMGGIGSFLLSFVFLFSSLFNSFLMFVHCSWLYLRGWLNQN